MKKALVIILTLFVLTLSIGPVFSRHVCLESNESQYGILIQDSCCEEEEKGLIGYTSTDCCEYFTVYLQVDFEGYDFQKSIQPTCDAGEVNIYSFNNFDFTSDYFPPITKEADPLHSNVSLSKIQSFLL